jgi:uncharacterized membrane protein
MSYELDEHRKTIAGYRRRLVAMAENFKSAAQSEQDDFKRHTMQWLAENVKISEGLYAELETQLTAIYGLRPNRTFERYSCSIT